MSAGQAFSPQVVVVGSHAPGIFMRVQHVPKTGETVIGWDFQEPKDGGKGSNQAIACARLGLRTSFVGCLGKDRIAEQAVSWLHQEGVDLSHLYFSETRNTGIGFILLDDDGVPAMVTSMGANEELNQVMVDSALTEFEGARVMLTQFEIRPEIALHAAKTAQAHGMLSIVNPAPASNVHAEDLAEADILIPNENEAKLLLDYDPEADLEPLRLAQELFDRSHAGCVLITLGEKGIAGVDQEGVWLESSPVVNVVDTSGAGDVFCAALAASIVKGNDLRQASRWAGQVATLSVTKPGTIPAYPNLAEVESFMNGL